MDSLLSILTGGATGLIGTLFSGIFATFKARADHKHEFKMRELDLEELKLERDSAERVEGIKAESAVNVADARALQSSYSLAMKRWTDNLQMTTAQTWILLFVDVVRGLMRPFLTIFFLYLSYHIWGDIFTGTITNTTQHFVNTILYLATLSASWYFGSRSIEKINGSHRN